MTQAKIERRAQPFDVVNKPKHYNSHPSEVEVKEVTNYLEFNLGNTFKYVLRYKDKEPERSLRSSMWYLEEHREVHLSASPDWLQCQKLMMRTPEWARITHLLSRVVNAEQDVLMKRFLIKFQAYALFEYRSKDFFDMKAALRDVIDAVANPTPAPPPVSSPNGDLGAP